MEYPDKKQLQAMMNLIAEALKMTENGQKIDSIKIKEEKSINGIDTVRNAVITYRLNILGKEKKITKRINVTYLTARVAMIRVMEGAL